MTDQARTERLLWLVKRGSLPADAAYYAGCDLDQLKAVLYSLGERVQRDLTARPNRRSV